MATVKFTKSAVINKSYVSGMPLVLLDNGDVHWLSLNYFLDLRRKGAAVSSIGTYGSHVTDFISQVEVDRKELEEIDDDWLEAYRESILSRGSELKGNSLNYASQLLRSAIAFMYWLELNRYIRGVVGDTKDSAVRIGTTGKGITHWLVEIDSAQGISISAPKAEWINKIKPYGPKRADLAERFELMIDWGISLGLRVMEICNFTIPQLPDLESADNALAKNELLFIPVLVNKGGAKKNIPVSPLLVKKTWQYIFTSRKTIVQTCMNRAEKNYDEYLDPRYIFLSSRSGQKLNPRSFSNSVRHAFLAAVDNGVLTEAQRVWPHGFRHCFVDSLLKTLDKHGVKRAEAVARQATRHSSEDAMQPYLVSRFDEVFSE